MNRTFDTILSLTLLHDYYNDGLTSDFVIVPTSATSHLLKRYRWIFRNTPQGFSISADNLAIAALSQLLAQRNVKLSFMLKLRNNSFLNFTSLPPKSGSKDIYCLYSQPGSEDLNMQVVALFPPVFTYTFTATSGVNSLQVTDPEGSTVFEENMEGIAGEPIRVSVNLEGYASGLYNFTSNEGSETIYITDESLNNSCFGLAEISIPATFNPEADGEYQYQFNARSAIWEYYLLFEKDYDNYDFSIEDTIGTAVFTQTLNPPDYDIGTQIAFASEDPITYREMPRTGLLLDISKPGPDREFEDLPSPSVHNPESKVYLTI